MIVHRCTLFVILLALGLLVQPARSQTSDQPVPRPEAAVLQPDQLSLSIQAIEQASDPSSAVAAYARGVALDPSSRKLLETYVDRMVDFGLPEVAYRQAQMLVDLDPNNGQAWAVLSYVSARHGRMTEAFADLVQAANREPDNRFVQATAGELLAWYDRNGASVPDSLKGSLEKIRQRMARQRAYVDAYTQATDELSRSTATRQRTSSAPRQQYGDTYQTVPQQYDNSMYLPSPGYLGSGIDYGLDSWDYSPLYPGGIYYPGYYPFYSSFYSPPYCYPPSYAYTNWWWPFGTFFWL